MSGAMVYGKAARDDWRAKLPEGVRSSASLLWRELDTQRELKAEAEKELVAESHRHRISRVLETCPGFGPIRTAQTIPVIVTPERFRTRQQL